MKHEALSVFALQRVDDLLVSCGTQGCHRQSLCFPAGEQRRTMGARQHACANCNRPHSARVTSVDTRLAVENLAAHDFRLDIAED